MKAAAVHDRDQIPLWLEHEIRVREPSLTRILGRNPNPGDAMALLHAFDRLVRDHKTQILETPIPRPRLVSAKTIL